MLKIKRAVHCAGPLALCAVIIGCSTVGLSTDKIEYKSVAPARPLDVPPDLSQLPRDDRYAVPGRPGVATASSVAAAARAQAPAGAVQAVAPTNPRARIERAGSERWLVVEMSPEQAFEAVKTFWESVGLGIEREDPSAGIIETVWAENRAKLPQDIIRRTIGTVLDQLYSTGERDRFRTRIERTPQNTAEIYITHRGMVEVYSSADKTSTTWQPRPSDPGLEAEMLQRLMVHLGGAAGQVGAPTQAAAGVTVIAVERQVSRIVAGADGGSLRLEIDEPFDRAWRRVGVALDRGDFTVEDRDRAGGVYFVRYLDPESAARQRDSQGFLSRVFGGEPRIKAQQLRIVVAGAGEKSLVSVLDKDGKPDTSGASKRILEMLHRQFGVAPVPATTPQQTAAATSTAPVAPNVVRAIRGKDGKLQRIELDEPVDRAWQRVGLALERGGINVEEADAMKGQYVVRYLDREAEKQQKESRGFLSRVLKDEPKAEAQQFRVAVTGEAARSTVAVLDKDGAADTTAAGQKLLAGLERLLPQFTFAPAPAAPGVSGPINDRAH